MKKILFMMYSMHLGGVEKSLVDLLNTICVNKDLDVTLLLLEEEGEFLDRIPKTVKKKVCKLPYHVYLEMTKSTKEGMITALRQGALLDAVRIFVDCLRNKGIDQQEVLKNCFYRWEHHLTCEAENYDIAIDYQGLGCFTTYYVAKFVNAKTKYTWIHNDIAVMSGNMEWQKEYYDCYDRVFCVSKQAMKETADRLPFVKKKVDTFHNLIPVDEIMLQAKEPCKELQGNCKILTIGRLSYEKGFDVAFRVISKLCQMGYDLYVYLLGEGEQHSELENLIGRLNMQEKIHLLGYQSNPYKYLRQCDIYFQPSRFEGFCITLGEAKIFCKPIITTDFAGAREQIENQVTGTIIPFDEDKMFEALLKMITDPKIRKSYEETLKGMNMKGTNDVYKLLTGVN